MADQHARSDVRSIEGTVDGMRARLSREYQVQVRTTGHRFGAEKYVDSAALNEVIFAAGVIEVGRAKFVADDVEDAEAWMASLEVVRAKRDELRSPAPAKLPRSFTTPLDGAVRWQYAVVNTGSFNSVARLNSALDHAGKAGWELVTVYDKSSNWFNGFEKGLMLLKRPVPEGVEVDQHCIVIQQAGEF